ncbi:MAG: hypothetical protein AAFU78_22885, partial [Cyanobacteria bacterium J06633_2]
MEHASDLQIPRKGDRYKHFKGNEYEVIGVTRSETPPDEFCPSIDAIAIHEETQEEVEVLCDENFGFIVVKDGKPLRKQFVIYSRASRSNDEKWWVRPLGNFMSSV